MHLTWLAVAFISGILTANALAITTRVWLFVGIGSIILSVTISLILRRLNRSIRFATFHDALKKFKPPIPIIIAIIFFFLGAIRYQSSLPDQNDPAFIASYNDTSNPMVVTGTIDEFPDVRDTYINLRVESSSIRHADSIIHTAVEGKILVKTAVGETYRYGDKIIAQGYLDQPGNSEEFSYRQYLERKGIYSIISNAEIHVIESGQGNKIISFIFQLRESAQKIIIKLWPDPEGSLFSGILLGLESGIPKPVKDDFNATGTSHIIAISGFNIAIISALFGRIFGRLPKRNWGMVLTIIAITIYTILVGADATVVRSAIMGGLSILAHQIGRRQHGINALAITAAAMALHDPNVPWDVSFQLSFAATLGLVLFAEPLSNWFKKFLLNWLPESTVDRLLAPVSEYILITIAAQLTTLPIIAVQFGRISLIAFIANPLILPAQPAIMIIGGLAVLAGMVWFQAGSMIAAIAWPFVLYTIRIVEAFAQLAGITLYFDNSSILWVVFYYIALFAIATFPKEVGELAARIKPIYLFGIIGALIVVLWRVYLSGPNGELKITFLDVGSGDAILIQSPDGRNVLINGGPSTSLLSDGLGRRLPLFSREIDMLVIASSQEEQIAGIPRILERYPPANVLWAGKPSLSYAADQLREALARLNIPITVAREGQTVSLGEDIVLTIMVVNQRGAILELTWGNFIGLFPLGSDFNSLEELNRGRKIGMVSLVLLAEQGFAPINPEDWIMNLNPQAIVLSVAADDADGLPDQETLETISGHPLLRTDLNGWIQIQTDGEKMWVITEK